MTMPHPSSQPMMMGFGGAMGMHMGGNMGGIHGGYAPHAMQSMLRGGGKWGSVSGVASVSAQLRTCCICPTQLRMLLNDPLSVTSYTSNIPWGHSADTA